MGTNEESYSIIPPGRSLYEKHLIKTGVGNGAREGIF